MDELWRVVELVGPFLLGAAGTLVASTFVTQRRLRTELAAESEMLDRMPRTVRVEMRADISRRGMLLVSMTRYPPMTRIDLVLSLVLIAALASAGALCVNTSELPNAPSINWLAIPGMLVVTALPWFAFAQSWAARASARLRFVVHHLGRDEAVPVAFMVRIGGVLILRVAPLLIAGLFAAYVGILGHTNGWPKLAWLAVPSFLYMISYFILIVMSRGSNLLERTDLILNGEKIRERRGHEAFDSYSAIVWSRPRHFTSIVDAIRSYRAAFRALRARK